MTEKRATRIAPKHNKLTAKKEVLNVCTWKFNDIQEVRNATIYQIKEYIHFIEAADVLAGADYDIMDAFMFDVKPAEGYAFVARVYAEAAEGVRRNWQAAAEAVEKAAAAGYISKLERKALLADVENNAAAQNEVNNMALNAIMEALTLYYRGLNTAYETFHSLTPYIS